MSFSPGICPECDRVIMASEKEIFVACPLCNKDISAVDSMKNLREFVTIPANIPTVIDICLQLEKRHGVDIPLIILHMVIENFPMNEEVAYLIVRMSGYETPEVRDFLSRFKNVKKKAPWAEDFLTGAITVRNMEYSAMFEEYILTKLPKFRHERFIQLLRDAKQAYTKVSTSPRAISTLYIFYAGCSAVNVALAIALVVLGINLLFSAFIGIAVLGLEIFLLFVHNRVYGNRMQITGIERHLMISYMVSIVLVIGGVFLGSLIGG